MNSTSMDNIRGVVNRSKDKDINLRQIKTNRYDRIERKWGLSLIYSYGKKKKGIWKMQ